MPKIIISAQAIIGAIEKQEIYRPTGPAAWRYWPQSAALYRGQAGNGHGLQNVALYSHEKYFFLRGVANVRG